MTQIKKIALLFLTLIPITAVSTAAQSKLLDFEDYDRINAIDENPVRAARKLLWNQQTAYLTYEEMYQNFVERSGLTDEFEIEREFDRNLQTFVDGGLLILASKGASTTAPSEW